MRIGISQASRCRGSGSSAALGSSVKPDECMDTDRGRSSGWSSRAELRVPADDIAKPSTSDAGEVPHGS